LEQNKTLYPQGCLDELDSLCDGDNIWFPFWRPVEPRHAEYEDVEQKSIDTTRNKTKSRKARHRQWRNTSEEAKKLATDQNFTHKAKTVSFCDRSALTEQNRKAPHRQGRNTSEEAKKSTTDQNFAHKANTDTFYDPLERGQKGETISTKKKKY